MTYLAIKSNIVDTIITTSSIISQIDTTEYHTPEYVHSMSLGCTYHFVANVAKTYSINND